MILNLTYQDLIAACWNRHGESRGCHRRCCANCGRPFFTSRPEARYCRAACRQRAYRQRLRARRVTLAHG